MTIRAYTEKDTAAMTRIWNAVVEEGVAFPQEECLDEESGKPRGVHSEGVCNTL